jgi:hypothetical protein
MAQRSSTWIADPHHVDHQRKGHLMVQKIIVRKLDDIDGSEAAETVRFGLDGTDYEIDLSDEHATALRGEVWKYVQAARRLGRVSPAARRRGAAAPPARPQQASAKERNQAIREWARSAGIEVRERGRIPGEIIDKYNRRNSAPVAS